MKKDTSTTDKKVLKFILEQQLPEARVEGIGTKPVEDAVAVNAVDHVTQIALETCRCVHLQEHLPHLLDLELCKAEHHPRGWVVANPVHSMHLQSQLEDSVPAWVHDKQPPVLYGEEQQRTMALNTEGIVEHWCPLDGYSAVIHDDTAMEKMEHMPTLKNINKSPIKQQPSAVASPSVATSTKLPSVSSSVSKEQPPSVTSSSAPLQSPKPNVVTKQESSAVSDVSGTKDPPNAETSEKKLEAKTSTPTKSSSGDEPKEKKASESSSPMKVDMLKDVSTQASSKNINEKNEPRKRDETEKEDASSAAKPDSEESTEAKTEPKGTTPPAGEAEKPQPIPSQILSSPAKETDAKEGSEASSKDVTTKESKKEGAPASDDKMEVDDPARPVATQEVKNAEKPPDVTSSSAQLVPSPAPTAAKEKSDEKDQSLPASANSSSGPAAIQEAFLPDEHFNHLKLEEDRIRLIRRSLSSHRILPKKKADPKKRTDTKKKRKREDLYRTPGIPGWHASNLKELTKEQEEQWVEAMDSSRKTVNRWLENFRKCRETYWDERERQLQPAPPPSRSNFYLPVDEHVSSRCCDSCKARSDGDKCGDMGATKKKRKPRRTFHGDDLMQCLDCGFVGCSPQSITKDSKQHILQHLLLSDHKFAVSCGERGQIFCFCCGDFVYHEVFEQERARIDYSKTVPVLAWKPHQLFRSFSPFHFMKTQDHGIVWRGLIATYPQLVPREHIRATEFTSRRQALFNGELQSRPFANRPAALSFSASQSLLSSKAARHSIVYPVGMYNLGNTCYKSAVLQCLVHCKPLQQYFLKENGHHHHACRLYRQWEYNRRRKRKAIVKPEDYICLACEMDRLFLSYYGSTIGVDVRGAVEEACSKDPSEVEVDDNVERGDPLVISEMLTASWKSGGMNSLASYKQHDSHEFLNSFLELFGKQTKEHWVRVNSALNMVKNNHCIVGENGKNEHDVVKRLFEGSLSSVLLCEECGTKRKRSEAFLNVSLSLSEEVARRESFGGSATESLSVEKCLERFVAAEKLGDPVDCPSCSKKTATQKQHTFGTLPGILCLHLKRFDAARNRKIDDFVSFPATGLNMGKYLSQWSEVSSVPSPTNNDAMALEPEIQYDLFGTVNHVGNMSSGHYITNVKVGGKWYTFNDAHVSLAGGNGGHETVVSDPRAYILFYLRRK